MPINHVWIIFFDGGPLYDKRILFSSPAPKRRLSTGVNILVYFPSSPLMLMAESFRLMENGKKKKQL
ncbi:unnamed protein product [Nezara viridula]|uniref:Uncharacterized protein n=1 Tax=Nezara viridula TaxID=85310 RepID=A0A9P0HQW7_NEZVI|nr:unnamed protein product [Nezara viridula]